MTSLPDLDSLALLVSVADSGSLGSAARTHQISQPSASARIKALERRLGVTLLARSTRGSTLTAQGQLVVEWSSAVLAAAAELTRGVAALAGTGSAKLTVAASLTIAEYLLPGWLVHLHAEHPDIAVALTVANSTDVASAVERREVPLGFVEGPSVPEPLASTVVGADELVVVVAPEHPWAARLEPLSMTTLRATPLLLREPGSGTRQAFEQAIGGADRLAPPALQLSTTTAIRSAAVQASAPAVLSELTVRADVAAGRLVIVPVEGLAVTRELRAVWRRGSRLPGTARALLALVSAAKPPAA